MIEYLNIFVQVVEQGSFTRAADILQIHRPTVSKAIQQIEDDLGVKLIHRTTRKLSVTAEGEAFYHRARLVLSEVNDMMASFSPTLPPRGRLRIDVPLALAHAILIPNLKHFQSLYPDIDVILVSSDKKTDLISEGVDCLVRLGELQDSSFISRRLGDISNCLEGKNYGATWWYDSSHSSFFLSIAFRMVSSLRIQATSATFLAFPAASRRT